MRKIRDIARTLRQRYAAWRQPPWPFASWADSPRPYRAWMALLFVIEVGAASVAALLAGVDLRPSGWLYGLLAVVITVLVMRSVFRTQELVAWGSQTLVTSALVFSGHIAEALVCAVVACFFSAAKRPLVHHLVLANLISATTGVLLMASVFQVVAGGNAPLSGTWIVAVFAAFLVDVVSDLAHAPSFVLGRYLSWASAWEDWKQVTRSWLLTVPALSMLVAAALAQPSPWYLLLLLVPQFLMNDVFRRSEEVVEAELAKRQLQQSFSRYVPASVVDQLVEGRHELELGGEQRVVTVLFADVRGFTSWSETRQPGEIVEELNALLSVLSDCIFETGGTLDKFTGDGLMAFWGAPLEDAEHAVHASTAAMEMVRRLVQFNALRPEGERFRLGIGLHTGAAVVGNVGHTNRMDYTAIGDTVNLSARIEAATKDLHASVLVTQSTLEQLPAGHAQAYEHAGTITVKGRREPVTVHRLVENGAQDFLGLTA